jgi:hypothetical protein
MSSVYKFRGAEISIATANTVALANLVRVYNSGSAAILNMAYANGTVYANCTVAQYESIVIEKATTDTLAGANMRGAPIAYRN